MAYDPSIAVGDLVRCMEPPLALHRPVARLISSARQPSGLAPLAMAWRWPR